MGYPTRVQLIKRKKSEQWYINFPAALAHAMEFSASELCEWFVEDKARLLLVRTEPPPPRCKKKLPPSSTNSGSSGTSAGPPSTKGAPGGGPSGVC
jgi:hypothetical protein